MNCPACMSFGLTDVEATAQVEGTLYCTQHGVEAWALTQMGGRRGGPSARRTPQFSKPVVPAPVEE